MYVPASQRSQEVDWRKGATLPAEHLLHGVAAELAEPDVRPGSPLHGERLTLLVNVWIALGKCQ